MQARYRRFKLFQQLRAKRAPVNGTVKGKPADLDGSLGKRDLSGEVGQKSRTSHECFVRLTSKGHLTTFSTRAEGLLDSRRWAKTRYRTKAGRQTVGVCRSNLASLGKRQTESCGALPGEAGTRAPTRAWGISRVFGVWCQSRSR